MPAAAIDIGSNTTRLLVAEPVKGRLKTVMQQRAFTRIGKEVRNGGGISGEKIEEVAEVVATQLRLAGEVGAEPVRAVATAAIRQAGNRDDLIEAVRSRCGVAPDILCEAEEARLSFLGATKTLGHPIEGEVAVVDVGGGSTEVAVGTLEGGVGWSCSIPVGSGSLADDFLSGDPPVAAELRDLRGAIDDLVGDAALPRARQAVAVGGSAGSLRRIVGAVLEHETLERAMRVLAGDEASEVARRFELDPLRVRMLPAGALLLERISGLLGAPLQIGKGGLREGVILDLLALVGEAEREAA